MSERDHWRIRVAKWLVRPLGYTVHRGPVTVDYDNSGRYPRVIIRGCDGITMGVPDPDVIRVQAMEERNAHVAS